MFFWVCKKEYVEEQVNKGLEKPFTNKLYPLCKYVFCPVCFLVLILGIIMGGIGLLEIAWQFGIGDCHAVFCFEKYKKGKNQKNEKKS